MPSSTTHRHLSAKAGRHDGNCRQTVVAPVKSSSKVIEVSAVISCSNEADSIGTCVKKALSAFAGAEIRGDVVATDNLGTLEYSTS